VRDIYQTPPAQLASTPRDEVSLFVLNDYCLLIMV